MKKINWKLRFQNKATLTALILGIIAIVYQLLDLFGVIPAFPQEQVVEIAMMIIEFLALSGIIVDPTTEGIKDSDRAMSYTKPFVSEEEEYAK